MLKPRFFPLILTFAVFALGVFYFIQRHLGLGYMSQDAFVYILLAADVGFAVSSLLEKKSAEKQSDDQ